MVYMIQNNILGPSPCKLNSPIMLPDGKRHYLTLCRCSLHFPWCFFCDSRPTNCMCLLTILCAVQPTGWMCLHIIFSAVQPTFGMCYHIMVCDVRPTCWNVSVAFGRVYLVSFSVKPRHDSHFLNLNITCRLKTSPPLKWFNPWLWLVDNPHWTPTIQILLW